MNDEIGKDAQHILAELNDVKAPTAHSTLLQDREASPLRRWVNLILNTKTDESKYKQVSAKGYRLK